MLNKIKFIRNKLLLGIIPTVLIAFLALAILITLSAQTIINDEVSAKVEKQVDFAKEQVVGHLVGHMKLSVGLAKTVEATGITSESKASLIELVKKMPVTNADTLGTGIFMADKYDGHTLVLTHTNLDQKSYILKTILLIIPRKDGIKLGIPTILLDGQIHIMTLLQASQ